MSTMSDSIPGVTDRKRTETGGPAARSVALASRPVSGHGERVNGWMQVPGAWVVGHRAAVSRNEHGFLARCSCGYASLTIPHVDPACLSLTSHLQAAVRAGAPVVGDDDGLAGVREPRRPLPPYSHETAELDSA